VVKVETFSNQNILFWKSAAVCRKIAPRSCAQLLNPRRRCRLQNKPTGYERIWTKFHGGKNSDLETSYTIFGANPV